MEITNDMKETKASNDRSGLFIHAVVQFMSVMWRADDYIRLAEQATSLFLRNKAEISQKAGTNINLSNG